MNKVAVSACLLLLLGSAAHAQMRPSAGAMFDGADANKDGLVSRDEFVGARASQFSRLDRNGDGFLDDADLPKRALARRQQNGSAQLLTQFDSNGDGRISKEEFVNGPTPVFDQADANKDGSLDKQELEVARASAKQAVSDARP